jgi:hypothetical protein
MKIVDGRRGEKKATKWSASRITAIPCLACAGQPQKRLSHIAKADFVDGIRGRLGNSDALHGISTVIDGRKWWHTLLPDAAVNQRLDIWFPYKFFSQSC